MGPVNARDRQLSALEPLELRLLPEEGLAFDEALPKAWVEEALKGGTRGLSFAPRQDGRITLEVTPLGSVEQQPPVRLRGRITATLSTDCVRCLESVSPVIEAELDLTLLAGPPEEAQPAKTKTTKIDGDNQKVEDWSAEDFPNPEDLADAVYRGDKVDLPEFIREGLLLGLTTHPVCEDEAGCDERTAALIDAANQPVKAAEADVDPRWAALKELDLDKGDPS
ncbi:MAG: DUF177 domain-containing protein [Pseudomonadota bacterium]